MLHGEGVHRVPALWALGQLRTVFPGPQKVSHVSPGNQRNRQGQVQLKGQGEGGESVATYNKDDKFITLSCDCDNQSQV